MKEMVKTEHFQTFIGSIVYQPVVKLFYNEILRTDRFPFSLPKRCRIGHNRGCFKHSYLSMTFYWTISKSLRRCLCPLKWPRRFYALAQLMRIYENSFHMHLNLVNKCFRRIYFVVYVWMRKWFTTTRENWAKLNWWKCNRLLLSYLYQALPLDIPLRSRTPYIKIRILIPGSFTVITIILSCPVVY